MPPRQAVHMIQQQIQGRSFSKLHTSAPSLDDTLFAAAISAHLCRVGWHASLPTSDQGAHTTCKALERKEAASAGSNLGDGRPSSADSIVVLGPQGGEGGLPTVPRLLSSMCSAERGMGPQLRPPASNR